MESLCYLEIFTKNSLRIIEWSDFIDCRIYPEEVGQSSGQQGHLVNRDQLEINYIELQSIYAKVFNTKSFNKYILKNSIL